MPPRRGPKKRNEPTLQGRITTLEKQLEAARRQCARQEALVRVTQRALGMAGTTKSKPTAPERDRAGRKKRRPMVRALKAARALQAQAAAAASPAPTDAGKFESASLQPTAPPVGAEEARPCSV
jgi:hypothetical protein